MSDSYVTVSDQDFNEQVLKSEAPIIVDFWATWCGPCIRMAPAFESLAEEYQGKMTFAKMDIDENEITATGLRIMSIPTLIIFQNGKEVDRIIGMVPREVLKRHVDDALSAVA